MYPLRFGLVFLTGDKKNLIKNWLYLKALFYTVGTNNQITGKCLIIVWFSPNVMFLPRAYQTAFWTLTVFYCVSITKLIFFSSCPGVVRGHRIRGIRPKEKESSHLTLHCISFFVVVIQVNFLVFAGPGGQGIFSFGKELQGSFPNNERGKFCKCEEYRGRNLVFVFRSRWV